MLVSDGYELRFINSFNRLDAFSSNLADERYQRPPDTARFRKTDCPGLRDARDSVLEVLAGMRHFTEFVEAFSISCNDYQSASN